MAFLLGLFVEAHRLGRILTNDGFIQLLNDPSHIRGMDVAYISYARLPAKGKLPNVLEIMPELVVEVKSPSNSCNELIEKTHDYLTAGVDAVILIDPETQSLGVYRLNQETISLTRNDTLALPDVLPGFA